MTDLLGFAPKPHGPDFSVERHRYGVILSGHPRLDDAAILLKQWGKEGLDTMAICLAAPLGACFVVCRWKDVPAWTSEVEANARARFPDDPDGQWLHGPHTGTSSLTLFLALCSEAWRGPALARLHGDANGDAPHDLDDFTRCRRVVEDVRPVWRARLATAVGGRPEWDPIIARWARLSPIARAADALPRKSKRRFDEAWRALAQRYAAEVAS